MIYIIELLTFLNVSSPYKQCLYNSIYLLEQFYRIYKCRSNHRIRHSKIFFFYSVCPEGWILFDSSCVRLESPSDIFLDAERVCVKANGTIAKLSAEQLPKVIMYMQMWGHGEGHGKVFFMTSEYRHAYLKV